MTYNSAENENYFLWKYYLESLQIIWILKFKPWPQITF